MRVAVLGAGVVGVTLAYELARDGHEVTVVERHAEPAGETSFANAGLVAPGHAYTWSSPKAPRILWRSLFEDGQALRFKPSLDPRLWSWSLKFLRNCTAERARTNTKRKVRLCMYSQGELNRIAAETGVDYHGLKGGLLYLYRTQETFERGAANTAILSEEGLELRAIDRDEAARIDPALAPVKDKFAGAVYCPSDESGDACVFTRNLARHCAERLGVVFRFDTAVEGFATEGDRVTGVRTDRGVIAADQYVNCLGVFAPGMAKGMGVSLPVYPIKGYSVTLPIDGRNNPPAIGGVDEDNLTAYARFGDRMRITATAEFAGYDTSHSPSDFDHMLGVARDIFPDGANYEQPSYWACLRPMTPEGTPIFGRGRYRNMTFNVGHGHMGWTMAAGCARVVADLLAGRKPAIDLTGMMLPG
ncbi:D-amino acid dehydrogenase [Marinivivus vitaminiproducens]|uniref:D-amino acid dehydrogenase n=1 Tax=Marinivivus vitaminiproducens TaxID=3035935 RepID=UPI00279E30DE|nr:D-amino acid dehydrogenase [Geminicoccaceae bacterium SCSIO 64248]